MAWCRRRCIAILGDFATRKTAAGATSTIASKWEKETKKTRTFSELIRRNSATLAPLMVEEKDKKGTMKEERLKSKSLYLCFEEQIIRFNVAHVIQSIELSHVLAAPTDGGHGCDELKLGEVAYRFGPDTYVPRKMSNSVIGSKIIFSGGIVFNRKERITNTLPKTILSKEVCVFETAPSIASNPTLQPSQVFKTSRPDPFLVEVAGELYCFGGPCYSESFEVFDKTHEKWLPLDVPPQRYPYGVCHAILGSKMLLWEKNQTGVVGFDVAQPEKGWTELDSCLGSCIPYVDGYDQLFVKLKSHRGDGFIMFSCNLEQPQTVRVFHISHECDSMKPMEPLQLPKLPHKFPVPTRCQFFHLEDNKVGLVFFRDRREYFYEDYDYFSPGDDDDDDVNEEEEEEEEVEEEEEEEEDVSRVRILVIIFEYEIAEKSMDIKYKLLTTRCLEYSTHPPEEGTKILLRSSEYKSERDPPEKMMEKFAP